MAANVSYQLKTREVLRVMRSGCERRKSAVVDVSTLMRDYHDDEFDCIEIFDGMLTYLYRSHYIQELGEFYNEIVKNVLRSFLAGFDAPRSGSVTRRFIILDKLSEIKARVMTLLTNVHGEYGYKGYVYLSSDLFNELLGIYDLTTIFVVLSSFYNETLVVIKQGAPGEYFINLPAVGSPRRGQPFVMATDPIVLKEKMGIYERKKRIDMFVLRRERVRAGCPVEAGDTIDQLQLLIDQAYAEIDAAYAIVLFNTG